MMLKKILQICFLCVLPLLLASCSPGGKIPEEYKLPQTELNDLLDHQLGDVSSLITSKEREKLLGLLEEQTALKAQRIAKKESQPSAKEEKLTLQLNELYNTHTAYYLLDGADAQEVDYQEELIPLEDYQNPVLDNLKDILSNADYQSIRKKAHAMQGDPYRAEGAYEEIYDILMEYPELDASMLTYYIFYSDETITLASFGIDDDYKLHYIPIPYVTKMRMNPRDVKEYNELWDFIRTILPQGGMDAVKLLTFASDGEGDLLAAVVPTNNLGSTWELEVDPADAVHKGRFTLTLLHEYMHYVTLNNKQVRYTWRSGFEVYAEDGMISRDNSYINLFYQKFWVDLLDDRLANRNSYLFNIRHYDEFVSFYAGTEPSEDICESFCAFLFLKKPTGESVWEQKVRFFYDFPELVAMREEIVRDVKMQGMAEEMYAALADEFDHIARPHNNNLQKAFGGKANT